MKVTLFWAVAGLTVLWSTLSAANDDVLRRAQDPAQWVLQNGDYASQRYSKLDQINRDNVKDLRVAWSFSTGVIGGHEGAPLVVDGMMFIHTPYPNTVFAIDLDKDSEIVWKYEPQQTWQIKGIECCDLANRGLAYADGKIFLHQADTTLIALDAKTGITRWKISNGNPAQGETGAVRRSSSRIR